MYGILIIQKWSCSQPYQMSGMVNNSSDKLFTAISEVLYAYNSSEKLFLAISEVWLAYNSSEKVVPSHIRGIVYMYL